MFAIMEYNNGWNCNYSFEECETIEEGFNKEEFDIESDQNPHGDSYRVIGFIQTSLKKKINKFKYDLLTILAKNELEIVTFTMKPTTELDRNNVRFASQVIVRAKVGHYFGFDDRGVLDGVIIEKIIS